MDKRGKQRVVDKRIKTRNKRNKAVVNRGELVFDQPHRRLQQTEVRREAQDDQERYEEEFEDDWMADFVPDFSFQDKSSDYDYLSLDYLLDDYDYYDTYYDTYFAKDTYGTCTCAYCSGRRNEKYNKAMYKTATDKAAADKGITSSTRASSPPPPLIWV